MRASRFAASQRICSQRLLKSKPLWPVAPGRFPEFMLPMPECEVLRRRSVIEICRAHAMVDQRVRVRDIEAAASANRFRRLDGASGAAPRANGGREMRMRPATAAWIAGGLSPCRDAGDHRTCYGADRASGDSLPVTLGARPPDCRSRLTCTALTLASNNVAALYPTSFSCSL